MVVLDFQLTGDPRLGSLHDELVGYPGVQVTAGGRSGLYAATLRSSKARNSRKWRSRAASL
jgi:hypothetical protein